MALQPPSGNLFSGYILAGGKSSRMGIDKGLMECRGTTMVERIIGQLLPVVGTLAIVSGNRAYERFGFEVIPDLFKDLGPAGGIHSALVHSSTPYNLVISCDTPFVTTAALEFIAGNAGNHEVVLPVHGGLVEPLLGVYAKSCLTSWEAMIRKGFVKLQEMVACLDLLKLEVEGNPLFKYPLFFNINTPEDFEKALTHL